MMGVQPQSSSVCNLNRQQELTAVFAKAAYAAHVVEFGIPVESKTSRDYCTYNSGGNSVDWSQRLKYGNTSTGYV